MSTTPLCVDLDGTLIYSDSLIELVLRILLKKPWLVFTLFAALLQGRVCFKAKVSSLVNLKDHVFPFNQEVINYIKEAKKANTPIFLATAAHESIAQHVAQELALFDGVIATSTSNLKGKAKAEVLVDKFGEHGFDYMGNSTADLPIWMRAKQSLIVNAPKSVVNKVKRLSQPYKVVSEKKSNLFFTVLRAIRVHQFSKNLLLFLPLISGHLYHSGAHIASVSLGFVLFSMTAASVYLLNDLVDLDSDRVHHSKFRRPLAAGSLPLWLGALLIPILLVTAVTLTVLFLPLGFLKVLAVYYVLTLCYSFFLKQQLLLDVVTLALLYTLRVIAGISILNSQYSAWLLAFALFLFFSLALVKRYSELLIHKRQNKLELKDKAYKVSDISVLGTLGVAAGLMSVLVLSLYINSPQVTRLYIHPIVLWGSVVVMLYWISRIWLMAGRELIHEDPVVFAIKDKVTWLLAIVVFCLFFFA